MTVEPERREAGLSVEEFTALPEEEGYRLELSRGRLVREPAPGPRHGHVAGRLYRGVQGFVDENDLGLVFFDTAFTLSTERRIVRVPDVAFVSAERIPEEGLTDRFWELAPDLAVEVVSPSSRVPEMQRTALDYLDAGARAVWVADPSERTVTVYRSRSDIRILSAGGKGGELGGAEGEAGEDGDVLEGAEVLPGFRLFLEELFG